MEIGTIIAISASASALIISTLGWIITHRLNIKAQNINFINRVTNDARLETTKAIRDYQDWLIKVSTTILTLSFDVVLQEHSVTVDWSKKIDSLRELFYAEKILVKWAFYLEEYEILFPKTAECRKDLLSRQGQIQGYLSSFLDELLSASMKSTSALKEVIEKAKKGVGIMYDQLGLMEDLRIYLQNLCLSSLTGNKIPERQPGDLSVPRLVQDEEGNLHVFTPQKNK